MLPDSNGFSREKPLVVALHGFFGCPEDFDFLKESLQSELDWVSLKLPGHAGFAEQPEAFSLEHLFEKINAAAAQKPFILLGYSMGGRLALQYAALHSDLLAGLVLIGASPGIADPLERQSRYREDQLLASQFEAGDVEFLWEHWSSQPLIATQRNIDINLYQSMVSNRFKHQPLGLAASLRQWGAGQLPSLWGNLTNIRCPVLLLSGAHDVKFNAINSRMHGLIPKSHLEVLPDVGHMAHLENTDAFLTIFKNWLHEIKILP